MCAHRKFGPSNETQFNGGWVRTPSNGYSIPTLTPTLTLAPALTVDRDQVYTSDVALHEWLLRSPHRVADGRDADYFYVPLYLSCLMNPVYDYTGRPTEIGSDTR